MLLINRNFKVKSAASSLKVQDQAETLATLVTKAKNTAFGKNYEFEKLLESEDLAASFRRSVPLTNYEQFYSSWLYKAVAGQSNVTWQGKIKYFALSSGTTNAASKKLPISKEMVKSFFKHTRKQALGLHKMDLPKNFYTTSCLTLGGSTQLIKEGAVHLGDLSGILQKNTPFLYRPFKKPGKSVSSMKDWDEKLEAIIRKAPKWNIGTIAGIPNWIVFVMEGVIQHYGLKNIHEIWPHFKICLHGGIELGTYRKKIESLCGQPICFLNTYLASEGYFAYQEGNSSNEMNILTKNGVFYEFIEKKHFPLLQNNELDIPTLSWNEVEKNTEYGLVISTNAGLWRYIIGDSIVFTNDDLTSIAFHGRVQQTMSAMGEHLSLANLTTAINKTAESLNLTFLEFCLHFDHKKSQHCWYIGSTNYTKPTEVSRVLDDHLKLLNEDYNYLRKFLLKEPVVKILPIAKFYEFLGKQQKMGGQNKFPRVLNGEQTEQWKRFLSS